MENVICNAYAFYFEFDSSFEKYCEEDREGRSAAKLLEDWKTIREDFHRVKEYLDPQEIERVHILVMEEF